MPYLYEGRQHRRNSEVPNCALAQVNMGVESIITFDAHDPRVQVMPQSLETVQPTYQFMAILKNEPVSKMDSDPL